MNKNRLNSRNKTIDSRSGLFNVARNKAIDSRSNLFNVDNRETI